MVILGGSMTCGMNIAKNDSWPAVLEVVVQEHLGSLQAALQQPFRKHCEPHAG